AHGAALAVDKARHYEAEGRARAAAEAASRAKDAFLATVSHELRTPLSPILAWSRMLRQGTLGEEKTRRALEVIERCARSQAQLVEDLLDVSRIITGKLRLEVRPVLLAPVVQAAVEVVRPAAEAKGLELHAGTVHAESSGEGQGAVFTARLPLAAAQTAGEAERRPPSPSAPASQREDAALDGLRVLVVDDEPDNKDVVGTLLSSRGAEV